MIKKKTNAPKYITKIFVRYRDNPAEWTELHGEVNLGSLRKPNNNILEVKIISDTQENFDRFGWLLR